MIVYLIHQDKIMFVLKQRVDKVRINYYTKISVANVKNLTKLQVKDLDGGPYIEKDNL